MKTTLATLLVLTTAATSAFAQSSDKERDNAKRLYQQVLELKAVINKLKQEAAVARDQAAHQRKLAETLRNLDEMKRVRVQLQRKTGKPRIVQFKDSGNPKVRIVRVRVEKHSKESTSKHEAMLKQAGHRLEHMGAAIKHLQAAGLKDLAAATMKRAGQFKKELGEIKKRMAHHVDRKPHFKHAEKHTKGGVAPNHLREISAAIMQLRKQVAGLQKAVERLERRK